MTGRKRGTESVKERWEGGVNEKRLTNRPTNCIREELIKTPDGPAGVSARGDSPSFISFSSKYRRFFSILEHSYPPILPFHNILSSHNNLSHLGLDISFRFPNIT